MFSKTLLNLIDYAIFPAVLLVTAKVLGVVFLSRYFQAGYEVNSFRMVFTNPEDFIAINSYSSLFVLATVVGGLLWVVVKAHVFHDSHIKPSLSAKLHNIDLQELINDNKVIFSQAFVWLSYTWLVTIMFAVQAFYGLSYWWVFYLGLGVAVVATALLVIDMEREIVNDEQKFLVNEKTTKRGRIITLQELRKEMSS